jgi:hypothetical protein
VSAVLTPQELEELTQKPAPQYRRQRRVLDHLGIPIKGERPDGSLVVLRIHAYGPQDAPPAHREPQLRLPS